jgi:hypothetical protein
MKPLTLTLSAAALLALAASPALSASRHHARHYYAPSTYGYDGRPFYSGGVNSPGPIYRQGRYLGTDPDPNVRSEIARDPYFARK